MGAADDAPRHSGNTSCQSPVRVKREGCVDASAGSRELDHQAGLPYRSAIFRTETLEFPSKDAFFAYARLQLIQDCGYEAVPSKRKPKKISVRCERYGVDGCPFRLSAFREGDDDHDSGSTGWRISAQHCAWQHSHGPAQVPRVSQPTAQALPSPAKRSRENGTDSPPPRTAVLYTGGEQFASVDDFITQTRELSLERYEVACWSLRRSADFASVGCALRQPSRCAYRVAAKRQGPGFVVDLSGCRWQHSHERGSTEVVEPGTSCSHKRDRPQQQRQASEGDVEGKDGCEVNGDDESGADPEDAGPGYCEDVTSETPIKIVPPAAPKVGDRFDTFNDAYTSFAVANILHLGKSITRSGTQKALAGTLYCPAVGSERACPFRAFLGPSRDGAHSTVLATSILHHNHVPRPALAADPTWRPPIRCKLVLAALAKSDSASQNARGRRQFEMPPPPLPKRARLSEPALPSTTFQATPAPPPIQRPRMSFPSRITHAQSTHSVSLVASFLAGLDHELVPLAPHLVDAGIGSLDSLTMFTCLSAAPRRAFLEDLHERVVAHNLGCPSPLRLLPLFPR